MNGFWERVAFAFRCFFSILFHGEIPNDIAHNRVQPAGPVPQVPADAVSSVSRLKQVEQPASEAFDRAVQILALLQRDGRLIDSWREHLRLSLRAAWSHRPHDPRNLPTGTQPVNKWAYWRYVVCEPVVCKRNLRSLRR